MLEAQLLGRKLLPLAACDGDRRSLGRSDNLEIACPHLYFAGLHLRVPHFDRARGDFTLEGNHGLETKLAGALDYVSRRPFRIERYLDESRAIAKIEENDSAKVSRAVDPTAEFDVGADVRRPELSA